MKVKKVVLLMALVSGFCTTPSCGSSNKGEATVEEVKNALPEELKDSVVLQEEEKSALDKLNSITDTSAHK